MSNKFLVAKSRIGALTGSFLIQALAGAMAVPLLFITHAHWVPGVTGLIFGVVTASFVGFVFLMFSFARDDASAVGPILGLKVIFVALLESAVDGKSVGLGVWLGAAISLVGVAFISQTDRWSLRLRDILRPGVALMALAAVCFAGCDILIKRSIGFWTASSSSWAYTLYMVVLMGGLAVVGLLCSKQLCRLAGLSTDCALDRGTLKSGAAPLIVSSVTVLLAQYFLFTSFAVGGQVTLTNILYNTRGLFMVAFAALLVLGGGSTVERAGRQAYIYRTIGVLLTLAAIVLAVLVK